MKLIGIIQIIIMEIIIQIRIIDIMIQSKITIITKIITKIIIATTRIIVDKYGIITKRKIIILIMLSQRSLGGILKKKILMKRTMKIMIIIMKIIIGKMKMKTIILIQIINGRLNQKMQTIFGEMIMINKFKITIQMKIKIIIE